MLLRFTDNLISQMTLDCNLNCKYCYEGSHIKNNKESLSFDNFKLALDQWIYERCILGSKDNSVIWHFHGGEPLLYNWEDFKRCVSYIEEKQKDFPNVSWCIQSNGTLLNDEIAKFFAEKNHMFGISFDGFSVTDRLSVEGNRKLIENLRYYKKRYGLRYQCLSTLSRKNMKTWFEDMRETSDIFDTCGVNLLCPAAGQEDLVPSAEEQWEYWFRPCLESFLTDNPVRERFVEMTLEGFIIKEIMNTEKISLFKTGCFDRICGHGVNMISLRPDLTLHQCDKYLEEGPFIKDRRECHLLDYDFLGLSQSKEYIHYCKSLFDLETSTGCDFCYVKDFCQGGCQSFNLSKYGKIIFDTEMCKIYKRIFNFLKLNWINILEKAPIRCYEKLVSFRPSSLQDLENFGYIGIIDLKNNEVKVEKRKK